MPGVSGCPVDRRSIRRCQHCGCKLDLAFALHYVNYEIFEPPRLYARKPIYMDSEFLALRNLGDNCVQTAHQHCRIAASSNPWVGRLSSEWQWQEYSVLYTSLYTRFNCFAAADDGTPLMYDVVCMNAWSWCSTQMSYSKMPKKYNHNRNQNNATDLHAAGLN